MTCCLQKTLWRRMVTFYWAFQPLAGCAGLHVGNPGQSGYMIPRVRYFLEFGRAKKDIGARHELQASFNPFGCRIPSNSENGDFQKRLRFSFWLPFQPCLTSKGPCLSFVVACLGSWGWMVMDPFIGKLDDNHKGILETMTSTYTRRGTVCRVGCGGKLPLLVDRLVSISIVILIIIVTFKLLLSRSFSHLFAFSVLVV